MANNFGISGAQQAVSQAINQPMFVNQRATSPYGGQGSAYTIDVLNSLQPLGVNPNQYPNMQPPPAAAAPAQNNNGPFSPQQQNALNNAFNQQSGAINGAGAFSSNREHGGVPAVMDKYGQMLATNAPGSGLPHPANMWSPEQLYGQSVFHRMGMGDFGSYAPGGFNYQAPAAGAAHPMAPMMPQQNFQSVLPPQMMAHSIGGAPLGRAPLPVNNLGMPAPLAMPQAPSRQNLYGGHYQSNRGYGGGGWR